MRGHGARRILVVIVSAVTSVAVAEAAGPAAPAATPPAAGPSTPAAPATAPPAAGPSTAAAPATAPPAVAPTTAAAPGVTHQLPPDAALVEYAPDRWGLLYRPEGKGPFPVVVWNHGAERTPGGVPDLAHFYTSHGWAFLIPHRRGHGRSPGDYIGNERDSAKLVALNDEHNADVIAAIAWVKKQPGIDAARVVVSGCSFGGIQTMITAAKDVGIRAAVPFAPGAIMWKRSPEVQQRLLRAAREAKVPVFMVQAENDYDVSPSRIAGAELEKMGRGRNRVHIYPPYGMTAQDGHGGFCTKGFDVWGADVLAFLGQATAPAARSATSGKAEKRAAPAPAPRATAASPR